MLIAKNKKIKKIWINGRFLHRRVTGVERVALELLRAIAQSYVDIHGFSSYYSLQFALVLAQDNQENIPDFLQQWPIQILGKKSNHLWEQMYLSRFSPEDYILNLCNTAAIFRQNQIVFLHDAQVFAIPDNFNWRFRYWYRLLFYFLSRRSKILLTNSLFSCQELEKYLKISSNRINIIHLGCDHMNIGTVYLPDEILAKIENKKFILAVSSNNANKNFRAVIKAIELLGNEAPLCLVVGQSYSPVFNQPTKLPQKMLALGYVSDAVLLALYQKAECLVYPSFYEGFGLPPLEAMVNNCLVIASNTAALPETCGQAAFFCSPENANTIAESILSILKLDSHKRQELRITAQNHALGFTWKKSAEKLMQIISK